jgi:hypothetical protein
MSRAAAILQRDLHDKKHEVARIYKDAQALAKAVEQLLQDFIARHGGDLEEVWGGINDSLSDLTDTAARDAVREMERLQRIVADAEMAELRREAPVVL